MDDQQEHFRHQQEHLRRQQEAEFWEDQERESSGQRPPRERDMSPRHNDESFHMNSTPLHDEVPADAGLHPSKPQSFDNTRLDAPEKKKGNLKVLYGIALLVAAALAYQGYRAWKKDDATLPVADTSHLRAPAGGPALPPVLGDVPLPEVAPAPAVADIATTPPAEPVQVAAPVQTVEPEQPTQAQTDLNARLDRLEARMNQVIEGLRAQGYIIGGGGANGQDLLPSSFAPRVVAPVASASVRRSQPRKPRPRTQVAKAMPAITQEQLLSVDMWDGRPSVVMGNGDANNPRVKVLQPGDSFNGITLDAVDVGGQRATFSNGERSVSLDVSN